MYLGHVKKRRNWKAKPASWLQAQAEAPFLSKRLLDLDMAGPGCSPTQTPVGRKPVKHKKAASVENASL